MHLLQAANISNVWPQQPPQLQSLSAQLPSRQGGTAKKPQSDGLCCTLAVNGGNGKTTASSINCFHKPHLRHLPEKWKRRREKKIKATQRPHILLISWWKRLVYRLLFIECTCAGELQPFCSQRLLPSPGRGQWPRLLPALMEMDDGFTPLMRLTRGAVPLQSWAPKQDDIFLRVSAFPKLSYISIENWKFREEH